MPTKAARNGLGLLISVLLLGALLAGGSFWAVSSFKNAFKPRLSVGCTATVGDASYRLAADQTQNAALISAVAVQRGMPARAASIALATGMQESKLRNIDYGDLDSVGLFQQRPSQDWGSVEQIMDPVYSTNAFYDALAQVPNYAELPINDAAQIVQRSGFPHAYAQHEPLSRAFASALTGQTPHGLNCTLPPAAAGSSPEEVIAAAQIAAGPLEATSTTAENGTTVRLASTEAHGWLLAHWALANAQQFGIVQVSHDGQQWDRNTNQDGHNSGWQAGGEAGPSDVVLLLAPAPAAN